jgi:hypothetical protein
LSVTAVDEGLPDRPELILIRILLVKGVDQFRCQVVRVEPGGGIVENIYISDIYMFNILTDSFLFDLFYGGRSASEALEEGYTGADDEKLYPVTEETPVFRNIFVKNLVSRNARRAMFFNGLPEMNIENIRLENAFITARYGAELSEAKDIVFDNVTVIAEEGPFYILNNVKNFKGVNLYFDKNTTEEVMWVKGSRTSTVELLPFLEDKIEISPEVDKNQIRISQD